MTSMVSSSSQRVDLFLFLRNRPEWLYVHSVGWCSVVVLSNSTCPELKRSPSVDSIIKIDSIKEIPGLIIDYFGRAPGYHRV